MVWKKEARYSRVRFLFRRVRLTKLCCGRSSWFKPSGDGQRKDGEEMLVRRDDS